MAGDERTYRDVITIRLKVAPVVLGVWTALAAALGLFHQWRFEHWMRIEEPANLLVLPVWLLAVDIALVVAGFGLLKIRSVGGRTPTRRYWAMVYVGFIAVAAMALLFLDVFRHMFVGSTFVM
jgi:hypothetical protein